MPTAIKCSQPIIRPLEMLHISIAVKQYKRLESLFLCSQKCVFVAKGIITMTVVSISWKQDFTCSNTLEIQAAVSVYNSQVICEKLHFFNISFFKQCIFKYSVFTGSSRTCGLQFS